MERYLLSKNDLPSTLYRIDYPGSRTIYSPSEGFVATDRLKVYAAQDILEFKQDIVNHFTWRCRNPGPFISFFSDREHAENWGLKQPWRGHASGRSRDAWALYVIDTQRLDETCFFSLKDLVEGLGLELPDKANQHIPGTYLCLHNLPSTAIIDIVGPEQVQYGEYLDGSALIARFELNPEKTRTIDCPGKEPKRRGGTILTVTVVSVRHSRRIGTP